MMIRIGGFRFSMTRIWTGRGVRPEEQVVGDVERVPVVPGRMMGREVEGLEVVVVGLDLGPVLDGEAHPGEDRLDLLLEEDDRMGRARVGAASRQGQVDGRAVPGAAARRAAFEGGDLSWTRTLRRVDEPARLGLVRGRRGPSCPRRGPVEAPFLRPRNRRS